MLKITEVMFSMRLVSLGKGSIIYSASTKDGIVIDRYFTSEGRAIEDAGSGSDEIDDVDIGHINKKSKDLVKVGAGFLTPTAKLAFTKLKQVFIKPFTLHHFNSKCHI